MASPQDTPNLQNLQIIGYASVLVETMLPTVVPPVFQDRQNPEHVFVPPYTLDGSSLCNATCISLAEWNALVSAGEVTAIDTPRAAQRAHEMWVAQDFTPHYEPRARADRNLRTIAQQHIDLATAELKQRRLPEADRLASIALAADDRMVDSMIVKAAVSQINNDPAGVRVMGLLAADLMTADTFQLAVKALADSVRKPRPSARVTTSGGPMSGMAGVEACEPLCAR